MPALVTIVTPSFNQGAFIGHTIRSVLSQDYGAIEYLVYDAGSTDNTHEVLRSYQARIRTIVAADGGQADAINRGFRSARGEIVAWLNSDDLYLPGAVASAVAYLGDHPQCAMVYGDAYYVDAAGQRIGRYPTGPVSRLAEGCYICQPATFMRREAVAAVGYLDASLQFCMDYDLWLRLASRYAVEYLPIPLACSRLHPGAKTVAQQLAFHREVVRMTCRRLGAAPLPWLYGYADLLVGRQLGQSLRGPRALAAALLTLALALRYHRRLRASDLRVLWRRMRSEPPGVEC
jgi:hypothetical protein